MLSGVSSNAVNTEKNEDLADKKKLQRKKRLQGKKK